MSRRITGLATELTSTSEREIMTAQQINRMNGLEPISNAITAFADTPAFAIEFNRTYYVTKQSIESDPAIPDSIILPDPTGQTDWIGRFINIILDVDVEFHLTYNIAGTIHSANLTTKKADWDTSNETYGLYCTATVRQLRNGDIRWVLSTKADKINDTDFEFDYDILHISTISDITLTDTHPVAHLPDPSLVSEGTTITVINALNDNLYGYIDSPNFDDIVIEYQPLGTQNNQLVTQYLTINNAKQNLYPADTIFPSQRKFSIQMKNGQWIPYIKSIDISPFIYPYGFVQIYSPDHSDNISGRYYTVNPYTLETKPYYYLDYSIAGCLFPTSGNNGEFGRQFIAANIRDIKIYPYDLYPFLHSNMHLVNPNHGSQKIYAGNFNNASLDETQLPSWLNIMSSIPNNPAYYFQVKCGGNGLECVWFTHINNFPIIGLQSPDDTYTIDFVYDIPTTDTPDWTVPGDPSATSVKLRIVYQVKSIGDQDYTINLPDGSTNTISVPAHYKYHYTIYKFANLTDTDPEATPLYRYLSLGNDKYEIEDATNLDGLQFKQSTDMTLDIHLSDLVLDIPTEYSVQGLTDIWG